MAWAHCGGLAHAVDGHPGQAHPDGPRLGCLGPHPALEHPWNGGGFGNNAVRRAPVLCC